MFILKALVLFYLGASLGSFTNVLVDRGQKDRSLFGRSKCDFCGHPLSWIENIPIAGFFLVHGKCRSCKRKLSWQYPVVEFVLAVLFLCIGFWSGFMTEPASFFMVIKTSYYLFLCFLLMAIFLWDLKYMIIPDSLVAGGIVVVLSYVFWGYFHADCLLFDIHCTVASSIFGGAVVSGFFYFLYFISKGKYIGGGDVKLGILLGMIVGWQFAYFLLLLAYVLGAIVAVYLLIAKKKNMRSQIPFGPFLIASTFIVLFFSEKLLYWYRQLL